eukprot:697309-Pleurochrysis_carterae.AAC.1
MHKASTIATRRGNQPTCKCAAATLLSGVTLSPWRVLRTQNDASSGIITLHDNHKAGGLQ